MVQFNFLCNMGGNTFGKLFSITTFGESHGEGIGVVIDGCPAGLDIDPQKIEQDLQRRRPGQSKVTTSRNEPDSCSILSGTLNNKTTGAPIALWIANTNQQSKDYKHLEHSFRPSHADYSYYAKYGIRDHKGGGRSSARETAARVAAGAIAKMLLDHYKVTIQAYVYAVGSISLNETSAIDYTEIEQNIVRCPNKDIATSMISAIGQIKKAGNTVGGIVKCEITGVPVGLGEPVFDRLNADLAKAMMSINAVKGFELGSGFEATRMMGSEHNDVFEMNEGKIVTKTNYSGGIQGGISNGMPIYFKVAFKPVSTIMQSQSSINTEGENVQLEAKGRHDPCVVPRAVPIVEAMAALTLADHLLRARASKI